MMIHKIKFDDIHIKKKLMFHYCHISFSIFIYKYVIHKFVIHKFIKIKM